MKQNNIKNIYRGDIIWVDLGEFPGSHRQSEKDHVWLSVQIKEMVRYIQ